MRVTDKYTDPIEAAKQRAIQEYEASNKNTPTTNTPGEVIKLPSEGRFYPESSPLRKGYVDMKYMTAREEDILTNPSYIQEGIVIQKLLESMIITPGVDSDDILTCDFDALVIGARCLGYGSKYKVTFAGKIYEINLNELTHNTWDIPTDANGYFDFKTETNTYKLKLITNEMSNNINKDQLITGFLKQCIVSINGNPEPEFIGHFIDNEMRRTESVQIQQFIIDNLPKVDLEIEIEGDDGNITKSRFRIGSDFFRD